MKPKEYLIGDEMRSNSQYQAACEYLAKKNFWNFNKNFISWDDNINRAKDCYYLYNYTRIIKDHENPYCMPSKCSKFVLKGTIPDFNKQVAYHGTATENVSSILKNNFSPLAHRVHGNAGANPNKKTFYSSLTPLYAQLYAKPEEWEDNKKKKWYVQIIFMIQQNPKNISKWLEWTCRNAENIKELHKLYGGHLSIKEIQCLQEKLTVDTTKYADIEIFAVLIKMHEENPQYGEYKVIEGLINDIKQFELSALAPVLQKNINQHFKLDFRLGMPEYSQLRDLGLAPNPNLMKNYIAKPGVDNPKQLQGLLASKPTKIQEMKHAISGAKGYEITTQGGQKVLLYDGYANKARPDLMAVRKIDQLGGIGYTNAWEPNGQNYQIGDLSTAEIMLANNKIIDVKEINKQNIKANSSFNASFMVGNAVGGMIANADQYYSFEDAAKNLGKELAIGTAITGIAAANSNIIPIIGWGIPGVFLAKDLLEISDSVSLVGEEAWIAAAKSIATTLVSIGSGFAGLWAGVEMGVALGAATGPGVIATGLIGGLVGGLAGGLISKNLNPSLKLTSSSFDDGEKLPDSFKEPFHSPDLIWENVPGKTKAFAILMQQGEKIKWLVLNIDPKERNWEAGKRDINLEKFTYFGINKNESKDINFMLIALSSKISQSDEMNKKAIGCGILRARID